MDITQKNEKPAIVMPECRLMLNEVVEYYIKKDLPKQAERLEQEFSKKRKEIEKMPGIGTKYKNGMRKTGLGKFRRYNIYYREKENNIEILGIWHTSRGEEFTDL